MRLWLIWCYFNSSISIEMFTTSEQFHMSSLFSQGLSDRYLSWIETVAMLTHGNLGVSVAVGFMSRFLFFFTPATVASESNLSDSKHTRYIV